TQVVRIANLTGTDTAHCPPERGGGGSAENGSGVGTSAKGGKMMHRIGNLALAIVSLSCFLGSASAYTLGDKDRVLSGIGRDGVKALAAGDISLADREYYEDYVAHPGNPLAIFNMAVSLRGQNRIEEADRLFSQAALLGQNYIPDYLLG